MMSRIELKKRCDDGTISRSEDGLGLRAEIFEKSKYPIAHRGFRMKVLSIARMRNTLGLQEVSKGLSAPCSRESEFYEDDDVPLGEKDSRVFRKLAATGITWAWTAPISSSR